MTVVNHPEADAIADTICAVLDAVAVAAGFARGQRYSERDMASVIFCSDPATLAPLLRARIDDDTHGPDGSHCIDLTVEAHRSPQHAWALTRADLDGETVLLNNDDLVGALGVIAAWLESQSTVT